MIESNSSRETHHCLSYIHIRTSQKVTSGMSVMETVNPLRECGLEVTDVVVVLDREQGGASRLQDEGLKLHSVLPISFLLKTLLKHNLIEKEKVEECEQFIVENNTYVPKEEAIAPKTPESAQSDPVRSNMKVCDRLSYQKRSELCQNALAAKLFKLMEHKKTNLCVAADVNTAEALLDLAEKIGPEICLLKTHCDVLDTWNKEVC